MSFTRNELIEIFQDTLWLFLNAATPHYNIPRPIYYDQCLIDENTTQFKPKYSSTKIIVENEDSFDMAKKIIDDESAKVLVLNMASAKRPGGGVENGASAQEECLFRRSNYFAHLPTQMYPLTKDALIVSRKVLVIKDKEYNMYRNRGLAPFTVDCIAVSAMVNPDKVFGENDVPVFKYDKDYQHTKQKIRNIFKVAYIGEYDTLVLGALGCGAFQNPTYDIAKIFREVIEEFKGCFKTISFAVLSSDNNPNYQIFKTHIETALNGKLTA